MYRLIDLFCGAGGMTLGFVDQGFSGRFKNVWAVDNKQAAIKTYTENFGSHAVCGNIEALIEGAEIPQADVVIGGPPCQGFSLLNKQRTGDERRALWQPYMDVVERCGAKVFVIENVAELSRSVECEHIIERAQSIGFDTSVHVLNSANFGVPQVRNRTFLLGWQKTISAPKFPPLPTHRAPKVTGNLPVWLTVMDAIGDLPHPVGTEIRDTPAPLDLHFGRSPRPVSVERYKMVPPGGNRFDLQKNAPHITPQCWIRKKSGGTDLFGRLWWDRPSVTIRTEFFKPEKGRYLHPDENRPITHREAARLMGFPDSFRFHGSKIEIARQIGNAVPPPLGAAVAEVVGEILASADRNRKAA